MCIRDNCFDDSSCNDYTEDAYTCEQIVCSTHPYPGYDRLLRYLGEEIPERETLYPVCA